MRTFAENLRAGALLLVFMDWITELIFPGNTSIASTLVLYSLLTAGYFGLGVLPTLLESTGLVSYGASTHFSGLTDSVFRWLIVPVLFIIMIVGSFIKSVISASVAKETTEATRARGYSAVSLRYFWQNERYPLQQAYQTDLSLHLPSYEEIPYDF